MSTHAVGIDKLYCGFNFIFSERFYMLNILVYFIVIAVNQVQILYADGITYLHN